MPYIFYHMGIYYGTLAILTINVINALSSIMLLKAKDLTPGRSESIYEILYFLFGRVSIFVYCVSVFVTNFGAIIAYYTIFGDILSHFFKKLLVDDNDVS